MAYLLDTEKKDTGSLFVPVTDGGDLTLTTANPMFVKADLSIGTTEETKYTFPADRAAETNSILEDVKGDGALQWVRNTGSVQFFNVDRITDAGTDYVLQSDDASVEIVSDTYNYVTLPLAALNPGKIYLVCRDSNTAFSLRTQGSDTIDGDTSIKFLNKYTHVSLASNGLDGWYIT